MSTTFIIPFDDVWTHSASGGTVKTMCAVKVPDVVGRRVRVMGLNAVTVDPTPLDDPIGVQIKRIFDVSAGGAGTPTDTIAAGSLPRPDALGPALAVEALRDYKAAVTFDAAEPTTYEDEALYQDGFNGRGRVSRRWEPDDEDIPTAGPDQLLGFLFWSKKGIAQKCSGQLIVEEY